MNRLLFADYIRRQRWYLLAIGVLSACLWFVTLLSLGSVLQGVIAVSMAAVAYGGALWSTQHLAPVEVLLRPISVREIHRTRWWVSTVLPVGVMTTGKLVGWGIASLSGWHPADLATIWLSSVIDFVFAGSFLCLLPALQAASSSNLKSPLKVTAILLVAMAVLFVPIVPLTLLKHLPTSWGELGIQSVLLIGVGGILTVVAYLLPPVARQASPHAAARARAVARFAWSPSWSPKLLGVTGIWRLAFKIWSGALIMQLTVPPAIIGFNVLLRSWTGDTDASWVSIVRQFGLLPFAADWHRSAVVMFFVYGGMLSTWRSGPAGDGIVAILRHLRVLPLRTHQLNALLIGLPALGLVNAWILAAAMQLVIGEPFVSWRLPEFFFVFGVHSLMRALQLSRRWPLVVSVIAAVVLVGAVVGLGRYAAPVVSSSPQLFFAAFGVVALLAAAEFNHRTLTTNRSSYTPRRLRTFGLAAPGD